MSPAVIKEMVYISVPAISPNQFMLSIGLAHIEGVVPEMSVNVEVIFAKDEVG